MDKAMVIMMLASFVTSYQNGPVYEQEQPQKYVPLPAEQDNGVSKDLPKFCNGVVCPVYKVLNTTEDYELRQYPASSWMTTELKGISYEKAVNKMFMRLFMYISGANDAKKKIPMTCPVLNKIIPGPGATCESDFTMYFYNDPELGDPPKATADTVNVTTVPQVEVYVKQFGGFAKYEEYRTNALDLGAALKKDGLDNTYITDYYYTVGYDAPYKLFNRHNEVWFIKK